MPTYTYECAACNKRHELITSISARKAEVPCECGGTADRVFDWQGHSFTKGVERPWKLDATSLPIGWLDGNTGAKQEKRYRKIVEEKRKLARRNDRKAIQQGIRHIASVPREVLRERNKQYGKDYLDPTIQTTSELKIKLKSDGLLLQEN